LLAAEPDGLRAKTIESGGLCLLGSRGGQLRHARPRSASRQMRKYGRSRVSRWLATAVWGGQTSGWPVVNQRARRPHLAGFSGAGGAIYMAARVASSQPWPVSTANWPPNMYFVLAAPPARPRHHLST